MPGEARSAPLGHPGRIAPAVRPRTSAGQRRLGPGRPFAGPLEQITESRRRWIIRSRRRAHRPEPFSDDRLLHDRPEIRGDPVDEQTRGEGEDEEDEHERKREHDHPLGLVGADGRKDRRKQLRPDVEHDQNDQNASGGLVGQVRDEEERRCIGFATGPGGWAPGRIDARADVVAEVGPQHVEERDEDRKLRE